MIESVIGWINTISGGSEMVAGALTLTISGMVGWGVKSLPKAVFQFFHKQFTTTLTFNNTDWEKRITFGRVSNFLQGLSTEIGSRTLSLDTFWDCEGGRKMVLTMGFGRHYFWYRGRLIYLNRESLESSGGDLLKEQITLTAFTRSHTIFKQLLEDNRPKTDDHLLSISTWVDGEWRLTSKVECGGLDSLALNPETVADFRNRVDFFNNNEEEHRRLGLPYKLTLLLHGRPGSGKSSLIRALGSEYKKNICLLNIMATGDTTFENAIQSAPKNSIIAIEDFDSASSVKARRKVSEAYTGKSAAIESETKLQKTLDEANADKDFADMMSGLSLTTILNTLDGICSLNDVIIVLTTNCVDAIDDALIRSGRIDGMVELPLLSPETVRAHMVNKYPELDNMDIPWVAVPGNEINRIKMYGKSDCNKIAEELRTVALKYENVEQLEVA